MTVTDLDALRDHVLSTACYLANLDRLKSAAAGGLNDCYEATVDALGYDPLAPSRPRWFLSDRGHTVHAENPWQRGRARCNYTLVLSETRTVAHAKLLHHPCKRCVQLVSFYQLAVR